MYTLGIELSTQSIKTVMIDLNSGDMVHSDAISYDRDFPQYGTRGGVLPSVSSDTCHTSPLMLIEALDAAFNNLAQTGIDLSKIRAIKADGMQHCTIYTKHRFSEALKSLTTERPLAVQLESCLSRETVPIWEDRSTEQEAAFLTKALKEKGDIVKLTGNRAELRFPAAQILKWGSQSPQAYDQTSRIWILSAFITALLAGKQAPVDTGDGWGTNLNHLDIQQPGWSDDVVYAADTYLKRHGVNSTLKEKLGEMTHYDTAVGRVSPYFVHKYGMSEDSVVLAGTGDNPATLLGCGGHLLISLGSSYTVCGVMDHICPSDLGSYNIFGYTRGKVMALSVITNGSKVHDHFLKKYFLSSDSAQPSARQWQGYMDSAGDLLLTVDEKLMLPYLMDESIPLRKKGFYREDLPEADASANIRALHLSQVLSLKCHADHIGKTDEICVVGGAAKSRILRQWIADAFGAETYTITASDVAAPLGCAISGARFVLEISYDEAAKRFIKRDPRSMCRPLPENSAIVPQLEKRYAALEETKQV